MDAPLNTVSPRGQDKRRSALVYYFLENYLGIFHTLICGDLLQELATAAGRSLDQIASTLQYAHALTRDHLRYMGSVGQNFGVDPNSMNMVVGIHSRNVVSGLATRVGLTPENLLPTIDLNRRLVNLAIRTRGDYLAAHERRHDLTMVSGVGASSSPVPAPSTTSPAEESSDSVHSSSTTTTAPIPTASLSVMQAPPPKQPAPTRLRAPHHPQQGSDAKSQVTTPGQGSPATSLLALPVAAEVASTLSSSHSSSTSGVLFAKSSGASHGCSPRMQVQALGSDSEEQASSKGAGVTHQPPAARCASDSSTAKTMAGHNKRSSEGEEERAGAVEVNTKRKTPEALQVEHQAEGDETDDQVKEKMWHEENIVDHRLAWSCLRDAGIKAGMKRVLQPRPWGDARNQQAGEKVAFSSEVLELMSEATQSFIISVLMELKKVAWERRGGINEELLQDLEARVNDPNKSAAIELRRGLTPVIKNVPREFLQKEEETHRQACEEREARWEAEVVEAMDAADQARRRKRVGDPDSLHSSTVDGLLAQSRSGWLSREQIAVNEFCRRVGQKHGLGLTGQALTAFKRKKRKNGATQDGSQDSQGGGDGNDNAKLLDEGNKDLSPPPCARRQSHESIDGDYELNANKDPDDEACELVRRVRQRIGPPQFQAVLRKQLQQSGGSSEAGAPGKGIANGGSGTNVVPDGMDGAQRSDVENVNDPPRTIEISIDDLNDFVHTACEGRRARGPLVSSGAYEIFHKLKRKVIIERARMPLQTDD